MAAPPLTWFEVIQTAPELASLAIIAQNSILAVANNLSASAWGGETNPTYLLARVYLAAHFGTMDKRRGVAGPVQSRSAGGIAEAWANAPLSTSFLSVTSYGQLYLSLARTRAFRAGTTTRNPNTGGWGGSGIF